MQAIFDYKKAEDLRKQRFILLNLLSEYKRLKASQGCNLNSEILKEKRAQIERISKALEMSAKSR